MPDSIEGRVRTVELDVARIGQRVEDHENDIRAFGPLVAEQAIARDKLVRLGEDIHGAHDSVRRLEERFEASVREIAKVREGREERERKQEIQNRRWRITTGIAAIGLFLTFVGMVVTVVAVTHP